METLSARKPKNSDYPKVAYFSMEVALDPRIPTYSGGLGVLAGDTLKATADQALPVIAITLLHRRGYARQHLDQTGKQTETPVTWSPEEHLTKLDKNISVKIEGRDVKVQAYQYLIKGVTGHKVPVVFLDTDLPENHPADRALTQSLYGGDEEYRLCQEVVLGLGGVAMLHELGHGDTEVYHMNEGHSSLLTLALLEQRTGAGKLKDFTAAQREDVRHHCVFTTHTPVPAGHDQFPVAMVEKVLGKDYLDVLIKTECCLEGRLNMTYLALNFSRYINGVAMRHGQISRGMFPQYPVYSITNGVHALTWTSEPFQKLFDRYIPDWKRQNLDLRHAVSIPTQEVWNAHMEIKKALLAEVEKRNGVKLDPNVFTIGFARRATAYKRADLVFSDLERLKKIVKEKGKIQVIYGGKAHPKDEGGKALIRKIFEASKALGDDLPVVYIEEYDMEVAKYLTTGVDLWLNTPQKPHEASGTSGMKAALNGIPSLSVLDGWWVEGHFEGITGWSIGETVEPEDEKVESQALYDKLENHILPLFYGDKEGFAKVMKSSIAINGSFFNTQRMILQYLDNAYRHNNGNGEQA